MSLKLSIVALIAGICLGAGWIFAHYPGSFTAFTHWVISKVHHKEECPKGYTCIKTAS